MSSYIIFFMPFNERKKRKEGDHTISDERTDRIRALGEIPQNDPNLQRIKEDPYAKKRREQVARVGGSWLSLMRRSGREGAQVPTMQMEVQQGSQERTPPNGENQELPISRRKTEKLKKTKKGKNVGPNKREEPAKDPLDEDLIKIPQSRKDNKGCWLFRRRRRKNLEKKIVKLMSEITIER